MKYLGQTSYVTKTSYEVFLVKYGLKNAQILESDFGKLQNWETFVILATSIFQGLFVN